jgi:flagellin-like protein
VPGTLRFSDSHDEGVSPVVGTILMVAITTVLAATVFVVVAPLGGGSGHDEPSGMILTYDRLHGRFQVAKVNTNGAVWSDFEVRLSVAGDLALNAAPGGALEATAGTFTQVAGAGTERGDDFVRPGDFLHLCVQDGPKTDVAVAIRELSPNTVVFDTALLELPDC